MIVYRELFWFGAEIACARSSRRQHRRPKTLAVHMSMPQPVPFPDIVNVKSTIRLAEHKSSLTRSVVKFHPVGRPHGVELGGR